MATTERTHIVLLEDSAAQALVRMSDGDTFYVAIADAARACLSVDKMKEFAPRFRAFLQVLEQWVAANKARIKSAHLTIRERDMLFLVMQREQEFDPGLSDALTDLDMAIAQNPEYQMIDMEVLAIPAVGERSMKAFLASGDTYTYAE